MQIRGNTIRALALGLGLAAPSVADANTPSQFDISCRFREETIAPGTKDNAAIALRPPIVERLVYRIDLRAGQTCIDPCGDITTTKTAPSGTISLSAEKTGDTPQTMYARIVVYVPATKSLTIRQMAAFQGQPVGSTQTYACQEQAFTPFPKL